MSDPLDLEAAIRRLVKAVEILAVRTESIIGTNDVRSVIELTFKAREHLGMDIWGPDPTGEDR